MNKMMAGMAVNPAGDADRDFVPMMVPHHQGAIDMAQAELQYGQNPQLKTIAQEIIVDQMQEITLTRLALGEPPPQSVSSPTQASSGAMQTSPAHESDANQIRCGCLRRCRWLRPGPLAPTDHNPGKEYRS
jgi:hypothetical protein